MIRVVALVLSVGACGLAALMFSGASTAEAHPLGNFTINRLAKLELLGNGEVRLRYVVDMAEIPTIEELRLIDVDRNSSVSDPEINAYAAKLAPQLVRGFLLEVKSRAIVLEPIASQASLNDGQAGLKTLRVVIDYRAALEIGWQSGADARFVDQNYPGRIGWRQIVVAPRNEVHLLQPTAFATDETAELTAYPPALLKSPPDMRELTFSFGAGGPAATTIGEASAKGPSSGATGSSPDRFARLIEETRLTPAFVALSLLIAMALGAAHALGPGHGKTIVAAYLVGSRGTVRQAILLGGVVTLTHTSSVLAVGLATLSASAFVSTEDVYLWLSLVSALLVAVMGLILFLVRLRSFLLSRARKEQHDSRHNHGSDEHPHGHSHVPSAPTVRGLVALGISGGILPCPTALVVMLGAIALDRVAYGLALVLAFGVGLAAVLTGIGILFVCTNGLVGRRTGLLRSRAAATAMQAAPLLGSLVILVSGLVMTRSVLLIL